MDGHSAGAPHRTAGALDEAEQRFVDALWSRASELYRDLPWRRTDDPYAILVSEIMLQQTQVSRVEGYWQRFLDVFPTLDALACADTALVLEMWQGLGYNRRALALKRTAEVCSRDFSGALPQTREELLALPGIGHATAGGVMAFAYREPGIYLETNVRTVFLHEFFPGAVLVSDKEIEPLVERTCSVDDPRGWYYALLDYGAHLKATLPNPSRRSKHHTVQSKFEGSRRQKRAELTRFVLGRGSVSFEEAYAWLSAFEADHGRTAPDPGAVASILADLATEGFFRVEESEEGVRYCL